ncbi:hypothetical protein Tsp_09387 [Trichinella spiralis]|uniref:hypothetical protein n=1 Tax=Trichinella spiralis TaxID=6334 RepID=UPI0001EFD152|nr:hypothetical protein Tsp_09387 [Trichinella spiralis]
MQCGQCKSACIIYVNNTSCNHVKIFEDESQIDLHLNAKSSAINTAGSLQQASVYFCFVHCTVEVVEPAVTRLRRVDSLGLISNRKYWCVTHLLTGVALTLCFENQYPLQLWPSDLISSRQTAASILEQFHFTKDDSNDSSSFASRSSAFYTATSCTL